MSRRHRDTESVQSLAELVETQTLDEVAPPVIAQPTRSPALKRDYRFKLRPGLFATPFVTLKGIPGDEAEARAELHRWLDAAIVGVECNPIRDPKTLKDIANGRVVFDDGSALQLPEGCNVEQDRDMWNLSLAGKRFMWRVGFAWHRVHMEIEQLNCARDRAKRSEKPKLFPVGAA